MILDHIRYLAIRERLYTLACLGIPYFDMPVVGCGEKFGAFVVECDVFDRL